MYATLEARARHDEADPEVDAFVVDHTAIAHPPLLPELRLRLATEITPLWEASEMWLRARGVPPPFWAFPWAGGQALARYVLDHPRLVEGKRVLDFATGSGMVGIAAAKAGAARVIAADIDPFAQAAARLNAALNEASMDVLCADLVGSALLGFDVVLAGDILYEQPTAGRVAAWLRELASMGVTVLLGDPGRAYLEQQGLDALAQYRVPTSIDLEGRDSRIAGVWRVQAQRPL